MSYRVIINNKYHTYNTKLDLMKDLVNYIKIKTIYKGMPRKERNIIEFAKQDNINFIIFGHYYTIKDIVKVAGGELL